MPVLDSGRKCVSEVLAGVSSTEEINGVDYNFARVLVKEGATAGEVVAPIGLPLVSDSAGAFVPYVDQDITAVTASTLPDGSPVCVAVGSSKGIGFNKKDITLDATGVEMVVIFRGEAALIREGIELVEGAEKVALVAQLEKQGIAVHNQAQEVVPSYVV